MAAGEFAQITTYLESAPKQGSEWVGDHDLYAALVDTAVRERNLARIRRYVPLAEETATRYGHRLYQAIASRARGVLHLMENEPKLAQVRLEQALNIFTELETHWQIGRTYFELFDLAKSSGEKEKAKNYLSLSQSAFEKGAVFEIELSGNSENFFAFLVSLPKPVTIKHYEQKRALNEN
jgi:hypothetical protein